MTVPRILRSATRGVVGALSMTGMRQVTTGLGLLERTPPEEILSDEAPALMRSLSEGHEQVAVELAHAGYGAFAGGAFALLPERFRRSRLAGPAYGIATWLAFELGIAPILGINISDRRHVTSRLSLVADHVLYGIVVAGQLAPEPERHEDDEDD